MKEGLCVRRRLRVSGDYLQPSSPSVAATASALQHDVRAICVDCESRCGPPARCLSVCIYACYYRRGVLLRPTYTTPYPTRSRPDCRSRIFTSRLHWCSERAGSDSESGGSESEYKAAQKTGRATATDYCKRDECCCNQKTFASDVIRQRE